MAQSQTPLQDAPGLCAMGAAELVRHYAAGTLSPVEVAQACLARAAAIDARFNAFTRIEHEQALASAAASQERWRRRQPASAIDGVPATIKDIAWVAGWPIRYGSTTTGTRPATADAPAVARLRAAGAVFLGLTATPEFGWKAVTDSPFSGVTRNPWAPALTPGGSSGGAAVAAATGAGVLHLGTDGGGSIRIPAGFTGIAGLKPTFGRVAAYPASPFGTVAHIGPMARRSDDLRLMLAAMAGRDLRDWNQGAATFPALGTARHGLGRARIGYWSAPPCGTVDAQVAAAVEAAVGRLEGLGAWVEPVDLPGGDLLDLFHRLWFAGAARRLETVPAERRAAVDPGFLAVAEAGGRYSAADHVAAEVERAEFGAAMDALLDRYDFLVSPGVAVLPFEAGQEVPPGSGLERWTQWAGFSFPVNLSQQPACVVPCGRTAGGLPVALQIVGPRGGDGDVLAAAAAFEEACPDFFL